MSKIEIFVFRHGETDWNKERRLQGHTDIPLNETGRTQAQTLTEKLNLLQPQVILSSDLSRALETAQIANRDLGVPMHQTRELRECRMGKPEGMLREEVATLFGAEAWTRWVSTNIEDLDFVFEEGESKREHLARMKTFLEDFIHTNSHFQKIAVSTHGGSLYRLLSRCEGAPPQIGPVMNCALYRLSYDRGTRRWTFLEESPQ